MNTRKFIALLAAALMLFSVLPMSTFAANGAISPIDNAVVEENIDPALIANGDFETGDATGWETWQSTAISADAAYSGSYGANIKGGGGWGGVLNQTFDVKDGETYVLSFWYKVNQNGFNIRFDGLQTGTCYAANWLTRQEWTLFVETFAVSGDTRIKINFSGAGNGTAEDAYIDDVQIVRKKTPAEYGYIINGDFETGVATPWNTYGTRTAVCAEAAHTGNYGLKMVSDGGWGGTGDQTFTTEIGKTYKVSLWIKTVDNGVNIQIQDNGSTATSVWINNASQWTEWVYEYTATSTIGKINFCGGGNNLATIVYVDDVTVKEVEAAEIVYGDANGDGKINNRDVAGLQQFLAKYEVTLDEACADANGDGKVNNRDVALLQQYLAKYDVALGPQSE